MHTEPLIGKRLETREWLSTLGKDLARVQFEKDDETRIVRELGARLASTTWHTTRGLEIIPYIDGTPAGTPRRTDVLWLGETLYVEELTKAKLARRVPEEIGKAFGNGRSDIKAALDYSFERSPQDVGDYMAENFKLAPVFDCSVQPDEEEAADKLPHEDARIDANASPPIADDPEDEVESPESEETTVDEPPEDTPEAHPPVTRVPVAPRPPKPTMIERFARAHGFRAVQERFVRDDGCWIGRATASPFPWEYHNAKGDLLRSYWIKDHCLERDPLQLEAEVWGLVVQRPESYSLILTDMRGEPIELTGSQLLAMRNGRKVTLYPATYRLVYDHAA